MRIVQNGPSLLELRSNTIWWGVIIAILFISLGILSLSSRHAWSGALLIPTGIIFFILFFQGSNISFDANTKLVSVHHWSLFRRENYSLKIADIERIMPEEFGTTRTITGVMLNIILKGNRSIRLSGGLTSYRAMTIKFTIQDFLEGLKEGKN